MADPRSLTDKMSEGWNISIECKGKGRTYEMTFETTATRVDKPAFLGGEYRHAVGNTIDEAIENLFKNDALISGVARKEELEKALGVRK